MTMTKNTFGEVVFLCSLHAWKSTLYPNSFFKSMLLDMWALRMCIWVILSTLKKPRE